MSSHLFSDPNDPNLRSKCMYIFISKRRQWNIYWKIIARLHKCANTLCSVACADCTRSVRKFRNDPPDTQDEEKRRQSQACAAVQSPFRIYDYPSRPWDALRDQDFRWSVPNGRHPRPTRLALTIASQRRLNGAHVARKGKTVAPYPLFAAVNLPRFSNFDTFALASPLAFSPRALILLTAGSHENIIPSSPPRAQGLRQYHKNDKGDEREREKER